MGDCHYLEGNVIAKARADAIRLTLGELGISPDRFDIKWVSSAEASRFAKLVNEFTDRIRSLGPNPLGQAMKQASGS